MKFEGIIFDMDGTLVHSENVWEAAEAEMFEARGLEYTDDVRQQVIGLRLDEFFEKLVAIYGLSESVAALQSELIERMLGKISRGGVWPKPGALELIDWVSAQGVPYCIASSSPMVIIEATVEAQDWSHLIPHFFTADDVPQGKPKPDVYLHAAKSLGVDPTGCLALEDSPNGAKAAVAAGMTCYVVPDFHSSPDDFEGITPHIYEDLYAVVDDLKQQESDS